jgi:hypothetical protein
MAIRSFGVRFRNGLSRIRNVQKQSRHWSSCPAMIIAEHSAESLTPFDSGVRVVKGAEGQQQAVFQPLMISLGMVVGNKLCDCVPQRCRSEEDHPI